MRTNDDPEPRSWHDLPADDLAVRYQQTTEALADRVNELASMGAALETCLRHPEAATASETCLRHPEAATASEACQLDRAR